MSSSDETVPISAAGAGAGTGGGTGAGPGAHPLSVVVPKVRARLAEDSAAGLASTSDEQIGALLGQVEGLSAQVESLRLSLVDQARRRGLGKTAGAASTASWLAGTSGRHPAGCGRDVKLARTLDDAELEPTRDALTAGTVCADQARVIADAVANLPDEAGPETRAQAQDYLLGQAQVFNAKDLAVLGRRILEVVDPELAERVLAKKLAEQEAEAERTRELSLSPDASTGGFCTRIRGKLDPETADMLTQALDPLSKPRPTDAHGPDTRTAAQRRGDGLHELLRRYLASGQSPTSHGLAPQVIVTITDHNLLTGTGLGRYLHTGTPVSAATAARYACSGQVRLYDDSGNTGEQGNPRAGNANGCNTSGSHDRANGAILTDPVRFFTGRLRRLLELRDRGCAFPGCDRPITWCEAHHIKAWIHGGRTELNNGVLLCGHHHRLIQPGQWTIRIAADGHPDFIPPDHIDPRQKPLRNTRLRL